jgi:hypothetical protein
MAVRAKSDAGPDPVTFFHAQYVMDVEEAWIGTMHATLLPLASVTRTHHDGGADLGIARVSRSHREEGLAVVATQHLSNRGKVIKSVRKRCIITGLGEIEYVHYAGAIPKDIGDCFCFWPPIVL